MDADLLRLQRYYTAAFPFDDFFAWLSYTPGGSSEVFGRREFSLTVARGGREFYLRWRSFTSGVALREAIVGMETVPHKFDIGAIYSHPVKDRELIGAVRCQPVERELVFDIDMNDYDELRTCCKDKKVCSKCWVFVSIAITIMTAALTEDFGFRHLMWVYSGRRGIHCWVLDRTARMLSSEGRAAVAEYMNYVGSTEPRKVRLPRGNTLSPFVARSYNLAIPLFNRLLTEQDFMSRGSPLVKWVDAYMNAGSKKMAAAYAQLKTTSWPTGSSSQLWSIVKQCCLEHRDLLTPVEVLFAFCYPRLDIQVSRDVGHLLKAPFCVHSGTGAICVPLPRHMWRNFDPATALTVTALKEELDSGKGLASTSLQPFLTYFKNDILIPLLEDTAQLANAPLDIPSNLTFEPISTADYETENVAPPSHPGKSLAYEQN